MRNRMMVAVAMGLMPALVAAQRIPVKIPTSVPREPRTTPEEPQPAPIARQLAMTRSRWSFESTNIASIVQAPGFGSDAGPLGRIWSLTGTDMHLEYRTWDGWSPTLDLSGATFGNSASSPLFPDPILSAMFAFEPGVRRHFSPINARMTPFVDVRANYMFADADYQMLALSGAGAAQQWISGSQLSQGFGGVAGVGMETVLTGPWSLTTEVSSIVDRMSVTSSSGASPSSRYWMRWTRLSIGVKYNRIIYQHLAERAIP